MVAALNADSPLEGCRAGHKRHPWTNGDRDPFVAAMLEHNHRHLEIPLATRCGIDPQIERSAQVGRRFSRTSWIP